MIAAPVLFTLDSVTVKTTIGGALVPLVVLSTALAVSLSTMLAVAVAPVIATAGLLEAAIWALSVSVASSSASSVTVTV